MPSFLKKIADAFKKAGHEYQHTCIVCGHVHDKGKGRVALCEKCGSPQQSRE